MSNRDKLTEYERGVSAIRFRKSCASLVTSDVITICLNFCRVTREVHVELMYPDGPQTKL